MNNGGPAFPHDVGRGPGGFVECESGMSLLDYFAGQAMISMVAGDGARMVADHDDTYDGMNWAKVVAANAFDFAAAMLAERERRMKKE